ncbi:Oidioi.mRNA.OKI2018_I69.XSR.g15141.t1.cds [Oikopleura dioica]|uniref:Oidioi.mRNA.OKI2018_I69.XSR.g15141.t1.cds n=1 Tax=Oikopleura dioica TaxID=34765 RepID=A0ABN7SL14_OIKDI|nr:Oidioi.mRNA.OKI2018_I69.XSR.g15141.t1.cds [Oikopleura dioica]
MKLFNLLSLSVLADNTEKFQARQREIEGQNAAENHDFSGSGGINFQQPALDSEEAAENFMPARHQCDACRIVTMVLRQKLQEKVDLYPSIKAGKKLLRESDVVDLVEGVCESEKSFEGAGVKVINGVERLAANGFETAEIPGVTQGGMSWPRRFKNYCFQIIEEQDSEWQIYNLFNKNKDQMDFELCFNGKNTACWKYPTAKSREEL